MNLPPPTSRQLSHLTLLKRNLLSRDSALLQRLRQHTALLVFQADGSSLWIRARFWARRECVCWTRLHISEDHTGFQPDVQLSLLPSIFVLTCVHGNKVTSSTAAGGWTRQKPGQPAKYPPPKTERQSRPLLSLKAAVK